MPRSTKKKTPVKNARVNIVRYEDNESLACCHENEKCPLQLRGILKHRLFQHDNQFYLCDFLTEQEEQLKSVIKQCVDFGESNSVLVIGPRGSGKSKLVQKVVRETLGDSRESCYYVYLSGIVHTDDRIALQDMARQLELENVVGDKVFGSFADNLTFLLDALKQDDGQSKSIVMELDEFDLFANHKNQSLLYNLFDIAQSRQNPLCVVGITCRLDVVELLEKRVKSRYSHRNILTFPSYNLDKYMEICSQLLYFKQPFDCCVFKSRWNRHVRKLFESDKAKKILEDQFCLLKDVGSLIRLLSLPICRLSKDHPFVTEEDLTQSYDNLHKDAKAALLNGLSILELSLVIAAKHLLDRRDGQPFNFEMVYNEYERFSKRRLSGTQTFSKAVTFKAYEHLIALELFRCTETFSQSSLAKEYKPMCMLIETSQIKEAFQKYPACPTELLSWCDSMFA